MIEKQSKKQVYFVPDSNINDLKNTDRPLFTKLLTPGLTCELCNSFDDWLELVSPTNHSADYIICGLTQELKIW